MQIREHLDAPRLTYHFEAFDKDGNLLWEETVENLVVNSGRDDVLDKYFKGVAYSASWYVGLKGSGGVAATDTMASHPGWSEVTAYSEASRQQLNLGTVSGQSVNNSASKASFSINSDTTTIAGAFVTTSSTKGGVTGLLYSASDFSANRVLGNGDTMNVTVTLTS